MSLSTPSILDSSVKQSLMAFWQFFPLWVSIVQPVVAFIMAAISKTASGSTVHTLETSHKAVRFVYIVLIITAGVNQLSTLSIVALSEFFPSMFATRFVGAFNFSKVFLPKGITPATKMPTIGDGTLLLLQYDNYTGSFSIALWATVLFLQNYRSQQKKNMNYTDLLFYGFVALALTGPLGYAVACLWARDELVFENESEEKKAQ